MQASTIWWILAGLAIAAELLSGGIYLLLIAVGLAAGAVAAHMGLGLPAQMGMAAVVGAVSVFICSRVRRQRAPELPAAANPDLNLDIGQTLHVPAWSADGSARISYRGSQWTVVLRAGSIPAPGSHRIIEVQGSRLVVDRAT